MPGPLFSILIPAYKDIYFKECVDSVLSQTYCNFELIIVNDCSPYGISEIVKGYNDPRIKYFINEKNYGAYHLVDNWNNGLRYVSGDYVICMGDDDKLMPNCLKDFAELIHQYPDLDIYHMRTLVIDEHSRVISIQEDRPTYESVYSMIWHYFIKHRIQYIGDWLFKTDSLKKNGGFVFTPYGWSADNLSAFATAMEKGVANTHVFGFQYRLTGQTISTGDYTLEETKAWSIATKWYEDFLSKTPNNEMDLLYWKSIIKNFQSIMQHIIEMEIKSDLSQRPYHIFKWLKKNNDIGTSKKQIRSLLWGVLRKNGFWYNMKITLLYLSTTRPLCYLFNKNSVNSPH